MRPGVLRCLIHVLQASFDPVARDGVVEFFAVALHRDTTDSGLDRHLPRTGHGPPLTTRAKRAEAPLRGIGSVPRYELVRLSREWRQRFS
jgi:hypothetical protein